VRVEVPPPLVEVPLSEQVGAGLPPPETLHVRFTVLVYPLSAVTVTVEVALPPGLTVAGDSALAEVVKSGDVVDVTIAAKASNGFPP